MEVIAVMPHLWIVPLVAGVLVVLGFLWFIGFERWFGNGYGGWQAVGVVWWVLGGLTAVVSIILLMPYDSKYHVFYRLEGNIVSVTNSFEHGSGELSYTPVVKLDTYDHPILMKSSRIMALEGKDVTLTCTLSWEPYGLDATYCGVAAIK